MWAGTLAKWLMHGWVDQIATKLKSFFTKNKWSNMGYYN
jgi:hypothetical protein